MKLFIETENGATKNHPAFEDNLIQVFGEVPPHWESFIRTERPALSVYQTIDSQEPVYAQVDGVWTDVWNLRNMTAEEKTAQQQTVITEFNSREQASNWSAWTLDETTCTMQPPIPRPAADQAKIDAGIRTYWCGADFNWKDAPIRPKGNYKFDFLEWQWVEIVDWMPNNLKN